MTEADIEMILEHVSLHHAGYFHNLLQHCRTTHQAYRQRRGCYIRLPIHPHTFQHGTTTLYKIILIQRSIQETLWSKQTKDATTCKQSINNNPFFYCNDGITARLNSQMYQLTSFCQATSILHLPSVLVTPNASHVYITTRPEPLNVFILQSWCVNDGFLMILWLGCTDRSIRISELGLWAWAWCIYLMIHYPESHADTDLVSISVSFSFRSLLHLPLIILSTGVDCNMAQEESAILRHNSQRDTSSTSALRDDTNRRKNDNDAASTNTEVLIHDIWLMIRIA